MGFSFSIRFCSAASSASFTARSIAASTIWRIFSARLSKPSSNRTFWVAASCRLGETLFFQVCLQALVQLRRHRHAKTLQSQERAFQDLRVCQFFAMRRITRQTEDLPQQDARSLAMPSSGRIDRDEIVSWPLGFYGGFNGTMTGRENVAFVARIYGQDPRRVLQEAEAFAEIGKSIALPVSTYSTGML